MTQPSREEAWMKNELERLIDLFILPGERNIVKQAVFADPKYQYKGAIRIASSAIPLFREVWTLLSTERQRHEEEMEKRIRKIIRHLPPFIHIRHSEEKPRCSACDEETGAQAIIDYILNALSHPSPKETKDGAPDRPNPSELCRHIECLVDHRGNPCTCDMKRYCPHCNASPETDPDHPDPVHEVVMHPERHMDVIHRAVEGANKDQRRTMGISEPNHEEK